ncbi:DNA-3-methyladenine glycosylase family protein [Parasphaerochaeta coccoides]|uniref:DNA-(apurinic or apyrimidinic site) lyase n=1 Tax=Parasphaerochaeta coccoides (strain ATCC BAA-1237 / DSM 17374 / SPN1) TaxID=760011 RepID=F4GHW7_PARC1|nr:DNA glycosylase [Parasphaerochaeta coccoides]AEC02080.1 DNA-(apurinic or apyrimidinic site) lyase [Parasphaerochaeta coccoides DSM 17374]
MENTVSSYLSLSGTFSCGQCFRWHQDEAGRWCGVAGGNAYYLEQRMVGNPSSILHADSFLRSYFALDMDYDSILRDIASRDRHLAHAVENSPGIRILRQDAFETLLSFIISQNNNIPRISGIIGRLCKAWGRRIHDGTDIEYAFPLPQALAEVSEQEFRDIGAGFRAPYLVDAVRRVLDGRLDLQIVPSLPISEARSVLQEVRGVGPKVAECVLLYGCGHLEAFPLDVWMKRAMVELFPGRDPGWFGPHAGIAQQYIFHMMRTQART